MAKATATTTPTITNPLVLALLAGSPAKAMRPSLGDRFVDTTVDAATRATQAAGQLSEAFDTVHYRDGVKKQKLRSLSNRSAYWANIQREYNLTDDELVAVINS
jgi:hypothetical protein